MLLLTIAADGSVQAAEVVESAGAALDEAARAAAVQLRFAPATRDGVPVAARIRYPYTFELPPLAATDTVPPAVEQAQPPATEEAIEVTVEGKSDAKQLRESARAVQVVETEQAKRETADLGEVLARTQGVGVRREGGLGSITRVSLNGFGDDQIRFFLDGVPLELAGFPFGMANVPVNLVERVEVYRGVVPIRFGADALGGAFNLVSAPLELGTHGSASYQLGSWGTHRVTAAASHLHEPTGLVARASGFFDVAENDYPVAARESGPGLGASMPAWERYHDGYRATGGTVEAGFVDRPWARRLLVRASLADYDKELQHNAVMTRPFGEVVYGGTTVGASLRYEQPLGAGVTMELLAGHTWGELYLQDLATCVYLWDGSCLEPNGQSRPGEIDAGLQDDVWTDRNSYGRLNLGWQIHPDHQLRFSASPTFFTRTGDDRLDQPGQRDPLAAERHVFTLVSGVEYEIDLFGGRLDNIVFLKDYRQALRSEERLQSGLYARRDVDLHRTGVGDSIRYRFADGLYGKASWEWATRLPSPHELFGNGVLIDANLRLQPETSHNFNLGLTVDGYDTALGALRADVNGFLRDADNLIVILGQDIRLQYQNVFAARSLGVEAAAGWTSPGGHLVLDGNLTFLDMRNVGEEGTFSQQAGDRIPNQPWFFANVAARVQAERLAQREDRAALVWNTRYVGEFFRKWESNGSIDSKAVIPTQLVHALALVYEMEAPIGTVSFTGEVQNLGDAAVFDAYGAQRPGRSLYFKTTATF